ncbi:TrbI/VirB10 family protein [Sphingopyxis sp.]|uniref:TrbI/VirB10 family protein n=1 Tax=Sphingopyxis sp. TaxID=1908224 RepID=UPI002CF72375|nr:TrbI/VirB10 family protein [Sphingopyxis sp.]HET6525367.1 TrbI/VirB10 family protein [Sphingopyxis sp.]HMO75302.1 TrbI/VirB10 family protein [Sphingopyxis sp.]HMP44411.1 TrbI/VirB10 family protein [Sphingopyxis sp.]HMQ19168.1 TrbI/VirB10 family protein [Sphingopyxis sp.]
MTAPEQPGTEAVPAEAEVAPIAPASPDAFRLAGETPQVMRLSRKTLAVIGGAGGIAIAASLMWALRTPAPAERQELYEPSNNARPDAVTGAPADYGAVPKLGPPLPGDLGRPIVAAQGSGEAIPVPPIGAEGRNPPDPRVAAAEQARQRALQERESAQTSRLFLGGGTSSSAATDIVSAEAAAPEQAAEPRTANEGRRQFLTSGTKRPLESGERLIAPSSALVVQAGTVIPAALITGIRSDLPGQISAQVTQNIYDSPTGRILLIPQGSRLIGEYDSEIAAGQSRVLLAWDRLILPGGRSIRLERQPGADAAGMSGLEDRVNNHWGRMVRAALVSTLLGVGSELSVGGDDELARALRYGMQDSTSQAGRRIVERELAVRPTLTIRPGFALRVIVTRDLILEPQADWR